MTRFVQKIFQNDSAIKFKVAYTVRLKTDEEIERSGTVAVRTLEGTLYMDVMVPEFNGTKAYPYTPANAEDEGQKVIIGFLNNYKSQPFILATLSNPPYTQEINSWRYLSERISINGSNGFINVDSDAIWNIIFGFNSEVNLSLQKINFSLGDCSESYSKKKETINEHTVDISKSTRTISEINDSIEKADLTLKSLSASSDDSWDFDLQQLNIKASDAELKSDSLKLKSDNVEIGNAPTDYAVLYTQLSSFLSTLLTALSTLTVTCTAPGSPSSPPVNLSVFLNLQQQLTTLKSQVLKIK